MNAVLKANATFPDKAPNSSSPLFDQQSTEASPLVNSHRVASFRQLSNTFSQFNNVQIPLRSRKPLTRKDAVAINEWRFSKLKEFNDRNIEVENEAFDRYMQNADLLEEVFSAKSILDRSIEDESSISSHNSTSMEDDNEATISGLKLKMRSNPQRTSNFRKRIQQIVDKGLKKLQKRELDDSDNGPVDPKELDKGPKSAKDWWAERASTLNDLIDHLNKARNEEDLKSCLEVKSQLFNHQKESQLKPGNTELLTEQIAKNDLESKEINFSLPKLITTTEIHQETLRSVDAHFSSIDQIENL
ncbi:electron carrier/iron ion-binding protein [Parasponia andersonii]|uniref:Electron carrier/iron ion-binding protein n=1 Tax=Parasponia andersonii TaxID=3476 RepID=A0A2P5BEB7_PARAD|nr:electron carrier/iron ion-binding protein [Parasponia andersonii]